MGWGQGIGIGWPNASAQGGTPGEMVYFEVLELCGGGIDPGSTTKLANNSIYHPGDYVEYFGGGGNRVLLGNETPSMGVTSYDISGPVYTSCPV